MEEEFVVTMTKYLLPNGDVPHFITTHHIMKRSIVEYYLKRIGEVLRGIHIYPLIITEIQVELIKGE